MGLAFYGESLAKTNAAEITRLTLIWVARWQETRGEKMKEASIMLLEKNIEKMTEFGPSIMLMKIKDL
ncbi:MAG: hypothetical protein ABSF71_13180 [Terriglobia bacterium]|jgi:hypothetical protein